MRNRDALGVPASLAAAAACCFAVLLAAAPARAAEYYVAPTGSDTAAGTMAAPFATIQRGNTAAVAGDTVWLRAGRYFNTQQITLSKSGTSNTNRTKFFAYPNEIPILDCSRYATSNRGADVPCILVSGNWMHLRGLEIANGPTTAVAGDHSISMLRTSRGASNDTFELLNIHHGFGPGLFIDTGMGGHLILNCDSHDNYDRQGSQGDGQNGDGFGVHYQTTGPSTIIRGCRAWLDSDDGYDLISQEVPVIVENSWAIQNGYANGGSTSPADGNGNGFKMGSSDTGIRHIVQRNVAWRNKAAGFYANHSSGGNTWLNNTAYMNGTQYNMLASPAGDPNTTITLTGALAHRMRNNIGFPNRNSNMGGVDTMFNTWDLGITPAAGDFVSVTDTGYTGPRQADGSLPAIDFMKLRAGSPMIDRGTNVQLPFVGTAPDLGAFEFGAPATTGAGGAGGGTGAGGTGGATTGTGGAGGGAGGSAGRDGGTGGSAGRDAGADTSTGTTGAGGATGTGTGGTTGTGTGGTTGTGTGGTTGTGTGTGGVAGTGGTGGSQTGAGGASGSGTGGVTGGTGGVTGTGGTSGPGQTDATGGCACALDGGGATGGVAGLAGALGIAVAFARRRRKGAR